jgi:hypothetical protein
MKYTVNFFFDGSAELPPIYQEIVNSWKNNSKADQVVVWNTEKILNNKDIQIPVEFKALLEKIKSQNFVSGNQASVYSAMSNWFSWMLLSSPKKIDNADVRLVLDADVFCCPSFDSIWENLPANFDAFGGCQVTGQASALVSVLGGKTTKEGNPFYKDVLRHIPGYLLTNRLQPQAIEAGSLFFSTYLMVKNPPNFYLFDKDVFYAYEAQQRTEGVLPDRKQLSTSKAVHCWFRSYSGRRTPKSNEEVVTRLKTIFGE